jgi:hypothetical protein
MAINNIKTILGLDAIVDYADNFTDGKEDFYDVLSIVKSDKDVMTIFNTKDDQIAFFTSGKDSESKNKEFLLFVAPTASDLFIFFHDKYIEITLQPDIDDDTRDKECNTIILLSKCLVQLANLDEDGLLNKLEGRDDIDD